MLQNGFNEPLELYQTGYSVYPEAERYSAQPKDLAMDALHRQFGQDPSAAASTPSLKISAAPELRML